MKIFRHIISIILSFLLMLSIMATAIIAYASKMIERDYILAKFEETDIYSQILEEAKSELKNYIYQSGMDESIIDSVCTKKKVKSDIISIVDSLYDNSEIEINTDEIEVKLNEEIDKIIDSQNRKISVEEQENIESFKKSILEGYKDTVGFYQTKDDTIQKYLPKVTENIDKFKTLAINITMVLMLALLVINIKVIFDGLNYIFISYFSSGILLILTNHLINTKISINELLILTDALSSAIATIVSEFMNSLVNIAKWEVLIGLVGILLIAITKMNKKVFTKS